MDKDTQPLYIFNKENPQNSEPQNGPRRGLDFIALSQTDVGIFYFFPITTSKEACNKLKLLNFDRDDLGLSFSLDFYIHSKSNIMV